MTRIETENSTTIVIYKLETLKDVRYGDHNSSKILLTQRFFITYISKLCISGIHCLFVLFNLLFILGTEPLPTNGYHGKGYFIYLTLLHWSQLIGLKICG